MPDRCASLSITSGTPAAMALRTCSSSGPCGGQGVDLQHRAGALGGGDDSVDVEATGSAPAERAGGGMEERCRRGSPSRGSPRRLLRRARVNAMDRHADDVELGEHRVLTSSEPSLLMFTGAAQHADAGLRRVPRDGAACSIRPCRAPSSTGRGCDR
jgi:hypothetical protein